MSPGKDRRVVVVVPCFDEEARFDAERFERFLERRNGVDLVLVDDGSRDRTRALLDEMAGRWAGRVEVVPLPENRGKAEAVRAGVLRAFDRPGTIQVGYWDADLATPLDAVDELSSVLDEHPEVDIVLGARVALLGRRIERTTGRHYLGRLFATAASLTLSLPVYDTQCGAKLFRATPGVRGIFTEPFGSRWIFDVEILARYLTLSGVTAGARGIYEVPLREWRDVGASKVRPRDYLKAGRELAAIWRRYPELRRRGRNRAPGPGGGTDDGG
jgi:glycosyltransferase involved in cell wall biosynthesis